MSCHFCVLQHSLIISSLLFVFVLERGVKTSASDIAERRFILPLKTKQTGASGTPCHKQPDVEHEKRGAGVMANKFVLQAIDILTLRFGYNRKILKTGSFVSCSWDSINIAPWIGLNFLFCCLYNFTFPSVFPPLFLWVLIIALFYSSVLSSFPRRRAIQR